jgi:hypothetical protein
LSSHFIGKQRNYIELKEELGFADLEIIDPKKIKEEDKTK